MAKQDDKLCDEMSRRIRDVLLQEIAPEMITHGVTTLHMLIPLPSFTLDAQITVELTELGEEFDEKVRRKYAVSKTN